MRDSRRILVLQHIAIEHPGIFRSFLEQDSIEWDPVELDDNQKIPALDGYDALWVMGGPMDVWQEAEYPWLREEKRVIREAVVERKLPFMGLCLGHQLLAEALGGRVGPSKVPEIGILDVGLTVEGESSDFLSGVSKTMKCLQWHGAEVTTVPEGAVVLASTPACEVQALSYGDHAVSFQFHVEISHDTVAEWGKVPEYQSALERNLGPGALGRMEAQALENIVGFNSDARVLYENWKSVTLS